MYCSRCGTWTPDGSTACARCGEPLTPQAPVIPGVEVVAPPAADPVGPPFTPPPTPHYAGFWRRFAAGFVDAVVLFFPDSILRVSAGLPTAFSMHPLREDEMGRMFGVLAAMAVIWWLYCALFESSRARGTLGQQLLGVQVGDRQGRRISFARATARYFSQYLSCALCGIGYLFNLWTARRQTLHDLVAGCVLFVPRRETAAEGIIMTGPRA